MTRLEKLIEELCPNGVEYKIIGDIAKYEQPTKYLVKSTDYSDDFSIPVLTAGQTFILGYTNETNGVYQASKEKPVIIFDDFTGAFKWVDFPFKVKSSAMKMITAKSGVLIRYLYHLMGFLNYTSDEHKRLWISIYSQFQIPLPPLEVQAEIVRILDNFTELTAELEAELEARKKQYEYYRDKLLNFDVHGGGTSECEWRTLGEIFNICNGYTPSKSNAEYWENGTIPWFRMEDIRENGRILFDALQHVTSEGIKKSGLFHKNSLIMSTTATIGEHALIKSDFICNQQITCFTLKDEFSKILNIKYCFYYFYLFGEWCKANVSNGGSLPIISSKKLAIYEIPIPPIKEQERIVSILDHFDKLCNDITEGLPAEIEARQKQYEYYRDKLLSFKEMS